MTLLSRNSRRSLLLPAMLCLLSTAIPRAQAADREEGLWQFANCGNADTFFVTVPKGKGFGNGSQGAELVNSNPDAGTPGLTLALRSLNRGNFLLMQFAVNLQDTQTAQNTYVHFCFSNGQTFDKTLSELMGNRQKIGWQPVAVSFFDFGRIQSSLIKVTFSLPNKGMLTIGQTLIQTSRASGIIPVSIELSTAKCSYLTDCTTPWSP